MYHLGHPCFICFSILREASPRYKDHEQCQELILHRPMLRGSSWCCVVARVLLCVLASICLPVHATHTHNTHTNTRARARGRLQARARDAHAAEDRNNVRPKYPLMATGTREKESVVVEVRRVNKGGGAQGRG